MMGKQSGRIEEEQMVGAVAEEGEKMGKIDTVQERNECNCYCKSKRLVLKMLNVQRTKQCL